MSFLQRAFSGSGRPTHRSTPSSASTAGTALFDVDDEEERDARALGGYQSGHNSDDDEDDDELEAAFGGGDRNQRQQHQHARDASNNDDGDDDEAGRLLEEGRSYEASSHQQHQPVASGSGLRQYSRTQSSTTLGNLSTVSAGGYDFEADPYDRRSAAVPVASTGGSNNGDAASSRSSRRRRSSPPTATMSRGGAFLAMIRDNVPLPARLRQYGLLNGSQGINSRRRADGTTDADDDEDDDDDDDPEGRSDWIMPPQSSMPGLFGGGTKNDGVFSNMTAKPGSRRGADGGEIVGGDDEVAEKEIPPAYEMAVLDSAPPYFDTTVHTSGGAGGALGGVSGGLEEILIEGLPLGNIFSFFWSLLVSMSFQFVGFLLTTMLSTSHAAKNGSRAGLGVTLIQYGLYLGQELADSSSVFNQSNQPGDVGPGGNTAWNQFWGEPDAAVSSGAASAIASATSTAANALATAAVASNSTDPWDGPVLLDGSTAMTGVANSWVSMVLMIGGWCRSPLVGRGNHQVGLTHLSWAISTVLLVSSVLAYLKVIRYAKALRDGVSSDSWLESGGFPALIARITGRDLLYMPQRSERTWGLPSRPAPASAPDPVVGPGAPPTIPFARRPLFGASAGSNVGTPSTSTRTPGTAGIPSLS